MRREEVVTKRLIDVDDELVEEAKQYLMRPASDRRVGGLR